MKTLVILCLAIKFHAIALGCGYSYYKLGLFYETVSGQDKDIVLAVINYEIAKTKGIVLASERLKQLSGSAVLSTNDLIALAKLYETGNEFVAKDLGQSMAYYQRAANQGDKTSALYLAQLYEIDHPHCKKNKSIAFTFYLKAAELKEPIALKALVRLAKETPSHHCRDLVRIYTAIFPNPQKANFWSLEYKKIEEAKQQLSYRT